MMGGSGERIHCYLTVVPYPNPTIDDLEPIFSENLRVVKQSV